jgi:hypothetical protein
VGSDFRVEQADGLLKLSGVIDEHADLSFFDRLAGHSRIHLGGVRRINSYGVRSWIEAVRRVPSGATYEFIECPPPVIDQMNMVRGFIGPGTVTSFFAPLSCEDDDTEIDHLFDVSACRAAGGKLPDVPCPKCGRPMGIDDLEDQYLLFVREE